MSGNLILDRVHSSADARDQVRTVAVSLIEHGYATDLEHAIDLLATAMSEPLPEATT